MSIRTSRLEAATLLGAAVLLLAFVIQVSGRMSSREQNARQDNLIPVFRQEDLREIRIQGRSTGAARLLRDPTNPDPRAFNLSYPGGTAVTHADEAAIAQLLSTLEHAPLLRRVDPAQVSVDGLGFAAPELELSVEMGSVSVRVLIGAPAPTPQGARYVQIASTGSDAVLGVTSSAVVDALARDGRAFLGKLVFRYTKGQTKTLVLGQGSERVELERDALGFRLGANGPRADRDRVDGLFFQMAQTSLSSFTDLPDPADFSEVTRIRQVPDEGPAAELRIARSCPGHPDLLWLYRTAPDPVAGCAARLLPLHVEREALMSRAVAPVRQDEVDHVLIDWEGRRLDLVRKDGAFLLQAPEEKALSLDRGREFLSELLALRGTPEPDPATGPPQAGASSAPPLGTLPVLGTLRLTTLPPHTDSSQVLEIKFSGSDSGNDLRFVRQDDGVTLGLPGSALELLDPGQNWLSDRTVFRIARADVVELSVEGPSFDKETIQRVNGEFRLADGSVPDVVHQDALLLILENLRAERFAKEASAADLSPSLSLIVKLRDGHQETLTIGRRTRSGYLATSSASPHVFVLAPDAIRVLNSSLLSRAPAQLPVHELERVTLSAFGSTTHLERQDDKLTLTQGSATELSEGIEEALGSLEIVTAVREHRRPAHLPKVELTIDAELGSPNKKHIQVQFGELVAGDTRPLQRLRVEGSRHDYYVDRASVVHLLDLL